MGWREFSRAEDGVSLVFVTITLPVLIGFALLAVDASRVYNLHYDLQKGADAFALAAAAELDGTSDSVERADRAIATLVENTHALSDLGVHTLTLGDITTRYLRDLPGVNGEPGDDDTEIPIGYVVDPLTEATEARFVEVTINPTQITSIFRATFLGGDNVGNYSASAVAGYESVVCNFTPMYICNPWEETGLDLEAVVQDRSQRRKLIRLLPRGGANANFPGNYGFLQPPDGRGANALKDSVARVHPNACFAANGVKLRPGQITSVNQAFNVRFDLYGGSYNNEDDNPEFRPARNVRKGYKAGNGANGACNPTAQTPQDGADGFMGLPRDNCFPPLGAGCGTIPGSTNTWGNGVWNLTQYWNTNHPGTPFPAGSGWADNDADRPTRYEVYRAEIDDPILNAHQSTAASRPEVGPPQCYSGGGLSDTPDRRLIYGAILNCNQLEEDYGPISGNSAPPVPVETFASFFMTEPLPNGPDDDLYIEIVDINSAQGEGTLNNVARDDVQLYR